jgi:hypothetical protein
VVEGLRKRGSNTRSIAIGSCWKPLKSPERIVGDVWTMGVTTQQPRSESDSYMEDMGRQRGTERLGETGRRQPRRDGRRLMRHDRPNEGLCCCGLEEQPELGWALKEDMKEGRVRNPLDGSIDRMEDDELIED